MYLLIKYMAWSINTNIDNHKHLRAHHDYRWFYLSKCSKYDPRVLIIFAVKSEKHKNRFWKLCGNAERLLEQDGALIIQIKKNTSNFHKSLITYFITCYLNNNPTILDSKCKHIWKFEITKLFFLTFPKYDMIKFYDAIQKYIEEENSIIKLK